MHARLWWEENRARIHDQYLWEEMSITFTNCYFHHLWSNFCTSDPNIVSSGLLLALATMTPGVRTACMCGSELSDLLFCLTFAMLVWYMFSFCCIVASLDRWFLCLFLSAISCWFGKQKVFIPLVMLQILPFPFLMGGKFFSVCLCLTVEGARAKLYQIPSVAYFALLWWIWAVMMLSWWLHIYWLCGKLDVKMLVIMRVIFDYPLVKSFSCIKKRSFKHMHIRVGSN